jgi:23S rRNA (cytosine1962-C5)-methyltransferase
MNNKTAILKNERVEKIAHNRHPWIFSRAIEMVTGEPQPGDIVRVIAGKKHICTAAYNPASDIRLRVINWGEEEITDTWFAERLKSLARRKETLLGISRLPESKKNYRLVFAEADGMPGLIIDRLGTVFVIQAQTYFADKHRALWISAVKSIFSPSAVFEKSNSEARKREGLGNGPEGIVSGNIAPDFFIEEDGFKIFVDIQSGQKTGYFLDLRTARHRIEHWCKMLGSSKVVNCFGYTGSFNLYAARAGAKKIEHIDASVQANALAKKNADANGFGAAVKITEADVFDFLHKSESSFADTIILDPPSFVRHRDRAEAALEGYERLNMLALKKLARNGLLFSFSCSSIVGEDDFKRMLFKAAAAAGCGLQILEKISHEPDHTLTIEFPEGRYLQGWILGKL